MISSALLAANSSSKALRQNSRGSWVGLPTKGTRPPSYSNSTLPVQMLLTGSRDQLRLFSPRRREFALMAQIFHPATNTFSKVTIFGGIFVLAGVAFAWDRIYRSSYVTEAD